MEDGETAAQAAVRELREETGYCGTVGRVSTVCYSDPGMTGELNSTRVPMFPMIRLHAHPGIFVHEGAPVLHPNPAHTIFTSSVPRTSSKEAQKEASHCRTSATGRLCLYLFVARGGMQTIAIQRHPVSNRLGMLVPIERAALSLRTQARPFGRADGGPAAFCCSL